MVARSLLALDVKAGKAAPLRAPLTPRALVLTVGDLAEVLHTVGEHVRAVQPEVGGLVIAGNGAPGVLLLGGVRLPGARCRGSRGLEVVVGVLADVSTHEVEAVV